jgi:hypothetical protein
MSPISPKQEAMFNSLTANVSSLSKTINDIAQNIQNGPGTSAYKAIQTNKLLAQYEAAKANLQNAPLDLSSAEKSYYIYNNGEDGGDSAYKAVIIDRNAKTADEFKKNSMEKQQQFMMEISQLLKQYQAEQVFVVRANELLKDRVEEHDRLKRSFNKYDSMIQTNERKVVYQINDMDNLYLYRRIMLFIYYSALVLYVVFGNFIPDKKYLSYSVWLILIIIALIPLILNRVIKWLHILKEYAGFWFKEIPHKDVLMDI